MLALVKLAGNAVPIADVPRVRFVPADMINFPLAIPFIRNPLSDNAPLVIVRLPWTLTVDPIVSVWPALLMVRLATVMELAFMVKLAPALMVMVDKPGRNVPLRVKSGAEALFTR